MTLQGMAKKRHGCAASAPRTVEFHRANIKQKLGARNMVDLVRRVLGE
jgi:DNA-binding NarL/FixJ family response regulator